MLSHKRFDEILATLALDSVPPAGARLVLEAEAHKAAKREKERAAAAQAESKRPSKAKISHMKHAKASPLVSTRHLTPRGVAAKNAADRIIRVWRTRARLKAAAAQSSPVEHASNTVAKLERLDEESTVSPSIATWSFADTVDVHETETKRAAEAAALRALASKSSAK